MKIHDLVLLLFLTLAVGCSLFAAYIPWQITAALIVVSLIGAGLKAHEMSSTDNRKGSV